MEHNLEQIGPLRGPMRLPLLLCALAMFTHIAHAQPQTSQPARTKAAAAKAPTVKTNRPNPPATSTPTLVPDHEHEELDAERLAVVPRVLVGESRCEMGKTVAIQPHPTLIGRFVLTHGKEAYTVTPQPTNTGVIRLENLRAGLVWLQVPIKSMLMDAKRGKRLADTCMHADQTAEVESSQVSAVGMQ